VFHSPYVEHLVQILMDHVILDSRLECASPAEHCKLSYRFVSNYFPEC